MLRKILNQRRELGKWQGPDPAQEDPGLHPLDPVHILLGGLPTNTHDLQKLAVIFSSSIREWIRYLVKRLPTSEGQIDLRWHVGVDTGLPWEAPWIIDPMAHPVKVAASRAEWELCYKKVLENDWNSENLLDRELAFKCDS